MLYWIQENIRLFPGDAMNTCKNDEVAVLTGDIIGSSKMDPQERIALYETFPRLSAMLKECYPSDVSYRISNFRGDGWQLIVDHTGKSLEIGLFIRTYIRFMFKKAIESNELHCKVKLKVIPRSFQ